MNARMLLGALAALSGIGCSGASVNDRISAQTEYDFTVADDRAQFQEQGLAFRGSVGPFAVYQVTAADPKLVGPFVQPQAEVGYAMLCGATKYFSPLKQANLAAMSLHGGRTGTLELVTTDQQPAYDGECAPPKDTFGNPLPDGGEGSDDMGPTSPPVFTPPGDSPDMTLVFTPPGATGGNLPVVQSIQVKFNPAPEPGSTVLIRRVALTNERQHNGSHVIPNICCKGGECSLGAIQ